jgi:hypothetical protein
LEATNLTHRVEKTKKKATDIKIKSTPAEFKNQDDQINPVFDIP